MSEPKRRRLANSELVFIGDSDDSNSSFEFGAQCVGKQDKVELAVEPDERQCTSKETDENKKRKRPIKPSTPKLSMESDDDDVPTGVPPYMTTEKYEELLKDSKERRLIWNQLRHGKY